MEFTHPGQLNLVIQWGNLSQSDHRENPQARHIVESTCLDQLTLVIQWGKKLLLDHRDQPLRWRTWVGNPLTKPPYHPSIHLCWESNPRGCKCYYIQGLAYCCWGNQITSMERGQNCHKWPSLRLEYWITNSPAHRPDNYLENPNPFHIPFEPWEILVLDITAARLTELESGVTSAPHKVALNYHLNTQRIIGVLTFHYHVWLNLQIIGTIVCAIGLKTSQSNSFPFLPILILYQDRPIHGAEEFHLMWWVGLSACWGGVLEINMHAVLFYSFTHCKYIQESLSLFFLSSEC